MIEVCKIILNEEFKAQTKSKLNERKQINDQINEANNALAKARNLLLREAINASDYRLIKTETEDKTRRLEAKMTSLPGDNFNVSKIIDQALNGFVHLDYLYESSDVINKRETISSIFSEKMTFDGFHCRTNRLNEAGLVMIRVALDGDQGDLCRCIQYVANSPSLIIAIPTSRVSVLMPIVVVASMFW